MKWKKTTIQPPYNEKIFYTHDINTFHEVEISTSLSINVTYYIHFYMEFKLDRYVYLYLLNVFFFFVVRIVEKMLRFFYLIPQTGFWPADGVCFIFTICLAKKIYGVSSYIHTVYIPWILWQKPGVNDECLSIGDNRYPDFYGVLVHTYTPWRTIVD